MFLNELEGIINQVQAHNSFIATSYETVTGKSMEETYKSLLLSNIEVNAMQALAGQTEIRF